MSLLKPQISLIFAVLLLTASPAPGQTKKPQHIHKYSSDSERDQNLRYEERLMQKVNTLDKNLIRRNDRQIKTVKQRYKIRDNNLRRNYTIRINKQQQNFQNGLNRIKRQSALVQQRIKLRDRNVQRNYTRRDTTLLKRYDTNDANFERRYTQSISRYQQQTQNTEDRIKHPRRRQYANLVLF